MNMALDHLHEQYSHHSILSDNIQLFWSITSSSSSSNSSSDEVVNDAPRIDDGSINIAVCYLLPINTLHHDNIASTVVDEDNNDNNHGGEMISSSYWLSFGLSPQGGMIGADMFIYIPNSAGSIANIANNSSSQYDHGLLLDVHGIKYTYPIIDNCGQDWEFVNTSVVEVHDGELSTTSSSEIKSNEAYHIVHVKRLLRSNDINEDVPFINDTYSSLFMMNPTKVIVAWGELKHGSDDESDGRLRKLSSSNSRNEKKKKTTTNELDLTSILVPHTPSNRLSSTVRFFAGGTSSSTTDINTSSYKEDEGNEQQQLDEDNYYLDGIPYIDLIPNEPYHIPNVETTYHNFCYSIQDFPELIAGSDNEQQQVHIVAFRDIIDGGGEDSPSSLVHHMDLQ